jgi:hypothetical protein
MATIDPSTALALRVGVAVVTRVAPVGFAYVQSVVRGKDVLVVGQSRAGKTTFVDYFQHGLFEDEKDVLKSYDLAVTPRFNVKIGRDAALELTVKSTADIPGQWGADKHADVAHERNPHAIILFVDGTPPSRPIPEDSESDPEVWTRTFCQRLEMHWRTDDEKRKNRLRSFVVLLNKVDRMPPDHVPVLRRRLRSAVDAELRDARGKMKDPIAVIGTCMVINENGTKMVDSAIAHIAKQLSK